MEIFFWLRMKLLLPWGSSSQSAHRGLCSSTGCPVCPDSCVMTWKRGILWEKSALILVGYGVTHWSVPAIPLLLAVGVQRSWSMRDLGGAPAWEGGVPAVHTRVPMMHTQPRTSQPGCPRRDPAPGTGRAANPPRGCVRLPVVRAEPIAVSSRYTGWNPLVLTPVCTGSSHQLEDELKFKTLEGSGTLSSR